MIRRSILAAVAAVVGAMSATAAFAEEAAFSGNPPGKLYAGLEIGRSESDINLQDALFGPTFSRYEGNATGFKVRLGYQFVRYVAVEGGYVSFGEFDIHAIPYACPGGAPGPCTYDFSSKSHGAYVNVVGSWPFAERWTLNGRAGLSQVWGETRQRDPDIEGSARTIERDTSGILIGLGVSCRMTPSIDAELAWSRFEQIGFALSMGGDALYFDVGDAQLLSLGMRYRF